MSVEADQIRDKRRALATPGGTHDKIVRFLSRALPAAIGGAAALLLISPLFPRGEISFLLDRQKVAIAEDRLRMDNAMYRGQDERGRPFSVTAGSAVQSSASVPEVKMKDLVARILLPDGPAVLSARGGTYDYQDESVAIDGPVQFDAADGYHLIARDVTIDIANKTMFGNGRTEGEVPSGRFSADRIRADLNARTIVLEGNARFYMEPGKLRMP